MVGVVHPAAAALLHVEEVEAAGQVGVINQKRGKYMKQYMKQSIFIFSIIAMMAGLTGCGTIGNLVNTGTTEYNELVALVQGVQSAASNFQLVTDTQYAKIQAKTQITKDYYNAVSNSGEVWTGNFRSQADALTELLKNYKDESGNPIDVSKLNLTSFAAKGRPPK